MPWAIPGYLVILQLGKFCGDLSHINESGIQNEQTYSYLLGELLLCLTTRWQGRRSYPFCLEQTPHGRISCRRMTLIYPLLEFYLDSVPESRRLHRCRAVHCLPSFFSRDVKATYTGVNMSSVHTLKQLTPAEDKGKDVKTLLDTSI